MEKVSWTDHMKREVLQRVKEERSILHVLKRKKGNSIGNVLGRNCLLNHAV